MRSYRLFFTENNHHGQILLTNIAGYQLKSFIEQTAEVVLNTTMMVPEVFFRTLFLLIMKDIHYGKYS